MRYLDIDNWNRKQHFEHFSRLKDPYFAVVVDVDITQAYQYSKDQNISFFSLYLHACMKAINTVENLRYRIQEEKVVIYDAIHASVTIPREDTTFGFSFVHYSEDFAIFNKNLEQEKERVTHSTELFPPVNSDDCVYASALPWYHFSSHKEPVSGRRESIPKLAFGKFVKKERKLMMPVSIAVNHALADGYHVGEFFKYYQAELNKIG